MSPIHTSRIALLAALVAVSAGHAGCGRSGEGPVVTVELEAKPNTPDGCTDCGCRAKGEVAPGTSGRWWLSFGLVEPGANGGWAASALASHCGSGAFEDVSRDFERTVGTPYLIVDLSVSPALLPEGDTDLALELSIRKLSQLDARGEPGYSRQTETRQLRFRNEGQIALPLLVPDDGDALKLGVHEVMLRLRSELLSGEPRAAFGAVSVSADVPGAEIRLDGGVVGRVADGRPTVLQGVLAGTREIRVRDFSRREAATQVIVEANQNVDVALTLVANAPPGSGADLIPLGGNPQGAEEFWRVKDRAPVVRVPAGEFRMGSPDSEGEPDERPQRTVHVSEFLIDKNEVTWRQLRSFAESTSAELPPAPVWGTPDDYPASFVLWAEAQAFCEWVGGRLPTEAEWEKAARGTEGWRYPWGNTWDATRCNSIAGGLHRPESVGSYPDCVTPYGVLDMAGSMWEWVADAYASTYYAEGPARDPKGPISGGLRVMRGGAWMTQPVWLRAAYRFEVSPASRNADHGFRCAMDAQS